MRNKKAKGLRKGVTHIALIRKISSELVNPYARYIRRNISRNQKYLVFDDYAVKFYNSKPVTGNRKPRIRYGSQNELIPNQMFFRQPKETSPLNIPW